MPSREYDAACCLLPAGGGTHAQLHGVELPASLSSLASFNAILPTHLPTARSPRSYGKNKCVGVRRNYMAHVVESRVDFPRVLVFLFRRRDFFVPDDGRVIDERFRYFFLRFYRRRNIYVYILFFLRVLRLDWWVDIHGNSFFRRRYVNLYSNRVRVFFSFYSSEICKNFSEKSIYDKPQFLN